MPTFTERLKDAAITGAEGMLPVLGPGVAAASAALGGNPLSAASKVQAVRLLFGAKSRMTKEQVLAAGGTILPGGDNTPPSAVMPNGARKFAVDTETDDEEGHSPAGEAEAHAAALAAAGPPVLPPDEPLQPNIPEFSTPSPESAGWGFSAAGQLKAAAQAQAGGDPVGDMIAMLKTEIMKPLPGFQGPRPLTTGEHIALGIIGALDPEAFQKEILPMLEKERALPMAAAEWERENHLKSITLMQTLAGLMSLQDSRESMAMSREETARHNTAMEGQAGARTAAMQAQEERLRAGQAESARHAKRMEDLAAERNRIAATKAKGKGMQVLDPPTKRELASISVIQRQARRCLAYLKAHPNVGYALTGPMSYFSKEFSDFGVMLGDLTSAFATGRSGKNVTKPELRMMGGLVPSMNKTPHQKVSSLEEILQWTIDKQDAIRDIYEMDGLPGEEQDGAPEGAPPGLTPIGMEIDDDLLGGE